MIDGRWLEIYLFCWLQKIYDAYNGSILMFDYVIMICDLADIDDTVVNGAIHSLRNSYDLFVPTNIELYHYYLKYKDKYRGLREFLGIIGTPEYDENNYYERGTRFNEETLDVLHKFIVTLDKIGGTMPCKRVQR